MASERIADIFADLKRDLLLLAGFVASLWVVEIVDAVVLDGGLDAFGIIPRDVNALPGILVAPFLHGGFKHLLLNSIGLLLFGSKLVLRGPREWALASAVVVLAGGLGVWLCARPVVHIGASGLVFGWFGYLLVIGFVERRIVSTLVSTGLLISYGVLLLAMLPSRSGFQEVPGAGISWESHLFGFLAGAALAVIWGRRLRAARAEAKASE